MIGKSWFLVAVLLLVMIHSCLGITSCKKKDLEALFKFKQSFTEDRNRVLSSWVGNDCCQWFGVTCDNVTSNVIKLNLASDHSLISPELSPALLELEFLTLLELSGNNFSGSQIPKFIGSMTNLNYLMLYNAEFSGPIPEEIGNLTNLIYLDLSSVDGEASKLYTEKTLEWISGLSKLQTLVMAANMSRANDALRVLLGLPSLSDLTLTHCALHKTHLSELLINDTTSYTISSTLQNLDLSINNLTGPFPFFLQHMSSLRSLSLANNSLSGSLPPWLGNMRHLEHLDVSNNDFNGGLPSELEQLTNLSFLELSFNGFQGRVPESLAKLTALKHLDLSYNKFNGLFPDILGNLSKIEVFDISANSIHGTIHGIGNLSKLTYLDLSFNNITLNSEFSRPPSFQIQYLFLKSCEINMELPLWLRNQTQLAWLDLSDSGVLGEFPKWILNMTSIQYLELGNNHLTGTFPQHINYEGSNLQFLYLPNNMLSGSIPYWLGRLRKITAVNLCRNLLSGVVFEGEDGSSVLTESTSLFLLDLSNNMLSGEIQVKDPLPDASLQILSLRGNNFSGLISSQLCKFQQLKILQLSLNRFTGHIPSCLGSLLFDSHYVEAIRTGLDTQEIIKGIVRLFDATTGVHSMIDLSCNQLVGTIPEELTHISKLMQLNLSNNQLTGVIPGDIGNLQMLESLDLSNNDLSGTIPQSLSNIPWISCLSFSNNHLHGPIPTGSQLQTLANPSMYAGNIGLCGFPLLKSCTEIEPPPSPTDDGEEDKHEKMWLYLVIMSGIATGFWGVVGTLVLKKSWRDAYFRYVEKTANKIYEPVKVRINRVKNRMRKETNAVYSRH